MRSNKLPHLPTPPRSAGLRRPGAKIARGKQADHLQAKKLQAKKLICGQSFIEVVVALAIFALLAATLLSLSVGSFIGLVRGGEQSAAAALAEEGIEAIRAIHDRAWNELIYSSAKVAPNIVSSQWELSSAISELIDNKYTRTITFDNVCRNAAGDIVACSGPGVYTDAHSKKATVKVEWTTGQGITNTVERAAYLTNWDSQEWTQTNWSGGSGQTIWADASRYDSDDGNINNNIAGSISLTKETGAWSPQGGSNVTDSDFSGGTTSGTVIENAGSDSANIILDQTTDWVEHPDSAFVTTVNLNDMSAVSDTNIWAVGNNGTILNYNGTNWSAVSSGVNNNLFGVHMVSAGLGWAVGGTARILRYQNGIWSPETVTGTTSTWYDAQFYPDGLGGWRGWVVGDNGRIRRYRFYNNTWTQELNFVFGQTTWRSVSVRSDSEAWVVGSNGNIRRWNGSTWTVVSSPVNNQLFGLHMYLNGASWQGWAVGGAGRIIYYNGTGWSTVSSPVNNELRSVYFISPTEGWAVGGNGKILRWNGTSWTEFRDTGQMMWLAVRFTSSGAGWVAGENGRIYEYNSFYNASGTFVSREFDSGSDTTVWNSLYWTELLPAGAAITIATRTRTAAGPWSAFSPELNNSAGSAITSPAGRYLQYRATLTRGPVGSETPKLADITIVYNTPTIEILHDLSIVSSNNIWAVGNIGTIINYDGTNWSAVSSGVNNNLYGIDMINTQANGGWIVGGSGRILRWNGTQWVNDPTSPTNRDLNAVFMVNSSDIWAVGNNGTIIHFDGSGWSIISSPVNNDLRSVYFVSPAEGWAVGGSGTILRYQSGSWQTVSSPVAGGLNSVFMLSADDGWAVGWQGKILRWTGGATQSWSEVADTGNQTWQSVYLTSPVNGWAVGASGNIYRFNGASWLPETSPTARDLESVEMLSENDGWAVGGNGTIIRFVQSGLYLTSGWLISSAFSMGDDSPVQTIEWDDNASLCAPICAVKAQVRAAPAGAPGAWTAWYGASGPATYFTNARGTMIPPALNNNRWVQYRVELSSDGTTTPVLDEVRINYK